MSRVSLNQDWIIKRVSGTFTGFAENDLQDFVNDGATGQDSRIDVIRMPFQVHDALIDAKIIENPNLRGINTDQWIGESDWVYVKRFRIEYPTGVWSLHFEGLDTFVDVYLNGNLIGSNEDAYLPLVINEIDSMEEDNTLVLYFHSPVRVVNATRVPDKYGGRVPRVSSVRVFRSGFHEFNGPIPDLVRVGVYGDIWLRSDSRPHLKDVDIYAELSLEDMRGNIELTCELGGCHDGIIVRSSVLDMHRHVVATAECYSGETMRITVNKPELWWPRTHGVPHTYQLMVEAVHQENLQVMDSVERTIGFRNIQRVSDLIEYTEVRNFAQGEEEWASHWDSDTMDVARTFKGGEPNGSTERYHEPKRNAIPIHGYRRPNA